MALTSEKLTELLKIAQEGAARPVTALTVVATSLPMLIAEVRKLEEPSKPVDAQEALRLTVEGLRRKAVNTGLDLATKMRESAAALEKRLGE